MKKYSTISLIILSRVISIYWFYFNGMKFTNLREWNIQYSFIISLSLLNIFIFENVEKKIYKYFLIILDFFLIELAFYPINNNSTIRFFVLFSHIMLAFRYLHMKEYLTFFCIFQILIQLYSGDILIDGNLVQGLSLVKRLELFLSQIIFLYIMAIFKSIETKADDASKNRLLYEQNLSNLLETNLDLQNYAIQQRKKARDDERKRIASELHDSLMHSLLNLKMTNETMRDRLPEAEESIIKLMDLSDSLLNGIWNNIESEIYDIRNKDDLEREGLHRIHDLIKIFEEATQIKVKTEYSNFPLTLGPQLDRILYRVIQEALTNAFRHGKADEIDVILWQEEELFRLVVRDNGIGGKTDSSKGIGLWGIDQRLSAVNGTVVFNSSRFGFEISVQIPKDNGYYEKNDAFSGR